MFSKCTLSAHSSMLIFCPSETLLSLLDATLRSSASMKTQMQIKWHRLEAWYCLFKALDLKAQGWPQTHASTKKDWQDQYQAMNVKSSIYIYKYYIYINIMNKLVSTNPTKKNRYIIYNNITWIFWSHYTGGASVFTCLLFCFKYLRYGLGKHLFFRKTI